MLLLTEVEMTVRVGPARPKTSRGDTTTPSTTVARPEPKKTTETQDASHLTATTIDKSSRRPSTFATGVNSIDARPLPAQDPALRPRAPQLARGLRNSSPIDSPTTGAAGLNVRQQQSVDQAVAAIRASATKITQAEGDHAQGQATVDASRTLAQQLTGRVPAVQAAILAQTRGSVGTIAEHLGRLTGEHTQQAVTHLTRATESVGRDQASVITDSIAPRLEQSLQGLGNNARELASAIDRSISNGDGALFGASLSNSLQAAGQNNLAALTATATDTGIQRVVRSFGEAQDRADRLDGQLARVARDWSGNFGKEAMQQGVQSYQDAHRAEYDRAASQAQRLSSTLAGAGLIADSRSQRSQLPERFSWTPQAYGLNNLPTQATAAADQVLDQLPRLGQTAAGSEAINEAVRRQSLGETTFLGAAARYAQGIEGLAQIRYREGLNSALGRAAALGAEKLAAAGRTQEIPQLMSRYSEASGRSEFGQVFAELGHESQRLVDRGFDPAEFSIAFAGASARVADRLFPSANPANQAMRGRIKALGAGIASAAFVNDPSIQNGLRLGESWARARFGSGSRVGRYLKGANVAFDAASFARDPNVENGLGLIGSASGLGANLTRAWRGVNGLRGAAAGALGRASLVTGLALSAWDTYGALQRGDTVGAAAAAAPAVGAGIGAAIGVWGGGVGAAPGAALGYAVGTVVQLGIGAGQRLFGATPRASFENGADSFLRGALRSEGLDPSLAKQLRRVGGAGGDVAGVGQVITEIAQRHGHPGRDVLQAFQGLSEQQREDRVEDLLAFPTNAEAIARARQRGGAHAELPRFAITGESDRGLFFRGISPEQFLARLGLQGG